jgi:isocitrate dehydrogenase
VLFLSKELTENEEKINAELIGSQGKKQEIGGYYRPDFKLLEKAMRPSETLNSILAKLN